MAKVIVRIPEPKEQYEVDNQRQISRALRSIVEQLKWCASEYRTYNCTSDSSHTKQVKYLNCGLRGWCPRCSMLYARKRAELMYQWIYQNLA